MSTRRAVRPDAMVYRQTRRLTRRKRPLWPVVVIGVVFVVLLVLVLWWWHKH